MSCTKNGAELDSLHNIAINETTSFPRNDDSQLDPIQELEGYTFGDIDTTGFDLEQAFITESFEDEDPGFAIVIPHNNNAELTASNPENQALFVVKRNGSFIGTYLLTTKNSDEIEYYNFESEYTFNITSSGGVVQSMTTAGPAVPPPPSALASCGQAVMDCVGDAYTNHGWISVWATVQTAFIPATAVGIAVACAGRNC